MCGEHKQGKERAQSHFPVCAWSQTPILGLVSHLISRKKCMRRALEQTGATIRLWYLALVSCQIGNFWSCCTARCATLTFSMQQPVGRNEEKVQQSQQKTVRRANNDHAIENEKINSSCITHTQKKLRKPSYSND